MCVLNLICVRDDDDALDGKGDALDHMISTQLKNCDHAEVYRIQ